MTVRCFPSYVGLKPSLGRPGATVKIWMLFCHQTTERLIELLIAVLNMGFVEYVVFCSSTEVIFRNMAYLLDCFRTWKRVSTNLCKTVILTRQMFIYLCRRTRRASWSTNSQSLLQHISRAMRHTPLSVGHWGSRCCSSRMREMNWSVAIAFNLN